MIILGEGMYFVTICTKNRENILSKILETDNCMDMSDTTLRKIRNKECRGVHCTSDNTKIEKIVEK